MSAAQTFESGEIVAGRYQLGARLGAGGFGVVFRAFDSKLQRDVALKILHHRDPDPVILQRFYREIELARQLTHPNTVRLYEFGETAAGVPFIAWELLEGRSLDQLIKREGKLPIERVARIGTQMLKSLMEAHARGIVHRDIKPANVFLCDYAGEADFVKVLDFGIAKPAQEGANPLTEEGATVGTPPYMAPEQVLQHRIDGRTDLYALGLVLAEAIAGYRVYNDRVSLRICMEQASPAPVPLPHTVVVSRLGGVIKRATQKKQDARYASAAEMLTELEAAMFVPAPPPAPIADVPTAPAMGATMPIAQPATMPLVVPPSPSPHRHWILATAAAGIFILAAVGGWLFPRTLAFVESAAPKRDHGSKPLKAEKRHPLLASYRIRGVAAQTIFDRLAADGWVTMQPSSNDGDSYTMVQYVLHKESVSGMLIFVSSKSDDHAAHTEKSYDDGRTAIVREQRNVLVIKLNQEAVSRALLERLLR